MKGVVHMMMDMSVWKAESCVSHGYMKWKTFLDEANVDWSFKIVQCNECEIALTQNS